LVSRWQDPSRSVHRKRHPRRGPLVAETPETGEIKDAFFEQRLALVDVAGGESHSISPVDMYVYEYDWSPDSSRFGVK